MNDSPYDRLPTDNFDEFWAIISSNYTIHDINALTLWASEMERLHAVATPRSLKEIIAEMREISES